MTACTARRWADRRGLPIYKLGPRIVHARAEDLDAWIRPTTRTRRAPVARTTCSVAVSLPTRARLRQVEELAGVSVGAAVALAVEAWLEGRAKGGAG